MQEKMGKILSVREGEDECRVVRELIGECMRVDLPLPVEMFEREQKREIGVHRREETDFSEKEELREKELNEESK